MSPALLVFVCTFVTAINAKALESFEVQPRYAWLRYFLKFNGEKAQTVKRSLGPLGIDDSVNSGPKSVSAIDGREAIEKKGRNSGTRILGYGANTVSSVKRPKIGYVDKSCNGSLGTVVGRFVSRYTKLLEENLKEGYPVKEFTTSFVETFDGTQISGKITFRNVVFNFGTALETTGDRICMLIEKVEVPVGVHYKMKFIVMTFEYLVEIGSESMAGSVQANLRDQDMWSYMRISKRNGSCTYKGGGLHIKNPDFNLYDSLFKTTRGFQDPNLTKQLESTINTFILKHVFSYVTKIPILYDALEKANVKSLTQAGEKSINEQGENVCHAI